MKKSILRNITKCLIHFKKNLKTKNIKYSDSTRSKIQNKQMHKIKA